ncbi:hypothetical protein [Microbacterium sp.]|uniref:hypothetical protein n=1 Tax=Microbacterium sp. TaxID=51671 RepID=UPI0028128852|nr:hypothetical protein [Microbacterium sp.]
MYEHPYLAYRVTAFEQEQAAVIAERRRVIMDNPDRIRSRPGVIARVLRAIAPRRETPVPVTAASVQVTSSSTARVPAERCPAGADCEAVAA